MPINIEPIQIASLHPINCELSAFKIAGKTIADLIAKRFPACDDREITVRADFIISADLAYKLTQTMSNCIVRDPVDHAELATVTLPGKTGVTDICPDAASKRIRHPWDLLAVNEQLVGEIKYNDIRGVVRPNVTIDGFVNLGENSVILPGVYIEGNVVIGKNCKIGPNCYLRGSTSIGDGCHIGQAVEIKNSLLGDKVSIGHLSYAGDSVICNRVNFGAGTIISNLRHDGKNHSWLLNRQLLDTGRRKFGAIIGENVHTGIHTAIYPGRSLSENTSTLPGEVVSHSK